MKLPFSVKTIENIPTPATGQVTYFDTSTRYLALNVTAAGGRVYYYIRKIKGRLLYIRLARADEITLREAREVVAKKTAAYTEVDIQRLTERCPTLQKTLDDWFEAKNIRGDKERNIKDSMSRLRKYVPAEYFSREIDKIPKSELQAIYLKTTQTGGVTTARHIVVDLRAAINYMIRLEYPIKRNPASGLMLLPKESRERFLHPDEIEKFFRALASADSEMFRDFVCIALFTSKRRTNVVEMRWKHIDFENNLWTIPKTETKNKTTDVTVLDEVVMTILRRRQADQAATRRKSEYVFYSSRSALGHYREPKTAWRTLLKRAGIDNLRIHDLRRTLASWMASRSISLHMIASILGQNSVEATPIYARLQTDPKRQAVAGAVSDLLRAGGMQATRAGLVRDARYESRQQLRQALEHDPDFEALVLQCWTEYSARPKSSSAAQKTPIRSRQLELLSEDSPMAVLPDPAVCQ